MQCRRPWFDSWVRKIRWRRDRLPTPVFLGFPSGSAGKESACNAWGLGSIPVLGRFPGEGKGYPLQYSDLENSMDRIVHRRLQRVRHDWATFTSHLPSVRTQASSGAESFFFPCGGWCSRFLEHGEYKENLYGTSLEAIRVVMAKNKVCLVDVEPDVSSWGQLGISH